MEALRKLGRKGTTYVITEMLLLTIATLFPARNTDTNNLNFSSLCNTLVDKLGFEITLKILPRKTTLHTSREIF